ncbi:hypothetical protein VPH35_027613 [Triticum aestivum]
MVHVEVWDLYPLLSNFCKKVPAILIDFCRRVTPLPHPLSLAHCGGDLDPAGRRRLSQSVPGTPARKSSGSASRAPSTLLSTSTQQPLPRSTPPGHHLAFIAPDYDGFVAGRKTHSTDVPEWMQPDGHTCQVFFLDPDD